MKRGRLLSLVAVGLSLGCGSNTVSTGTGSVLTIVGSIHTAGPLTALHSTVNGGGGTPVGDPASMSITMYGLNLASSGSCTGSSNVQDYGAAGQVKDFTASPTLFQADVSPGTYNCVGVHLSDVIGFTSTVDSLGCHTATQYWMDIYRPDQNDTWLDPSQNPIAVSGTDSLPSNDKPWIYFTTDTAAAYAAGFSHGQVILLGNALTVPSTVTFVWDATNAVGDDGAGHCGMNPGKPSFQ
jgi:hypothetical protein